MGFLETWSRRSFLTALLDEIEQRCDSVINLEVPDDVLVSRMLERGRADDKEDVIRNRLEVYRAQTEPLIAFLPSPRAAALCGWQSSIE